MGHLQLAQRGIGNILGEQHPSGPSSHTLEFHGTLTLNGTENSLQLFHQSETNKGELAATYAANLAHFFLFFYIQKRIYMGYIFSNINKGKN